MNLNGNSHSHACCLLEWLVSAKVVLWATAHTIRRAFRVAKIYIRDHELKSETVPRRSVLSASPSIKSLNNGTVRSERPDFVTPFWLLIWNSVSQRESVARKAVNKRISIVLGRRVFEFHSPVCVAAQLSACCSPQPARFINMNKTGGSRRAPVAEGEKTPSIIPAVLRQPGGILKQGDPLVSFFLE